MPQPTSRSEPSGRLFLCGWLDLEAAAIGIDGSVQTEAEQGPLHFNTLDAFIAYLRANAPDYSKPVYTKPSE
jgi:hypothetical protein